MKPLSSRLVRLARLVGVALLGAALAACSSASVSVIFPTSALVIPVGYVLPGAVPGGCSGQTYFELTTTLLCKTPTYFLCDGQTYTEYDCESPGAGWSVETQVPDNLSPPASSSGASSSVSQTASSGTGVSSGGSTSRGAASSASTTSLVSTTGGVSTSSSGAPTITASTSAASTGGSS